MIETISTWLFEAWTIFGHEIPHWALPALVLFMVTERLLAKSSRPEFRSLMGLLALAARWVLRPIAIIPKIGPWLIHVIELLAGVDVDGDGVVGQVESDVGSPSAPGIQGHDWPAPPTRPDEGTDE